MAPCLYIYRLGILEEVPLPTGVLDMQWIVIQPDVHLVILGNDSTQYLFPYLPLTDRILGPSNEDFLLQAHPLEPSMTAPYHHGVLTCQDGVIVSTTGHDIVGHHLSSPSFFFFFFCLLPDPNH